MPTKQKMVLGFIGFISTGMISLSFVMFINTQIMPIIRNDKLNRKQDEILYKLNQIDTKLENCIPKIEKKREKCNPEIEICNPKFGLWKPE